MVRAMIVDGKLYVLESNQGDQDHRKKALATLQSIHRSISNIPDPRQMPNIEFVFVVKDFAETPSLPLWTLARRQQDENLWLMPDFGFWSWDLQDLGPFDEVVSQVIRDEAENYWETKTQKLIWRGKLPMAPKLRRALLASTKGKLWSDVEGLTPAIPPTVVSNYVSAADQCKYMFIAHAEGRSYSGSLKYRQACHSVIIIHKMQWIQHHHYLLISSGPLQNFVEVERDFSDLSSNMDHLINNSEEAKRIADNNVKTFRERYLTPAAESCYWKQLVRGWAEVSEEPEVWESEVEWRKRGNGVRKMRGMRFENFALLESEKQMAFNGR